jgi:hypothetical protein
VVLVVLALIWAGVIVLWLRSRAASGDFHDSVGMFSRHLHVLERTGPTTVRAANRMRGPSLASQVPYRPVPRGYTGGMRAQGANTGPYRTGAPSAAALRRRQSRKRRRDILLLLIGAAAGTLLLGAVPGLHTLLYLNVVIDLLLVAYIGLLIHMRNMAAERSARLAWLPRVQPVPSGAVRRGTGRYASLGSGVESPELVFGQVAN